MNQELEGQKSNFENSTQLTTQFENILIEWNQEINSEENLQKQLLAQIRNFDEQSLIQKATLQKNRIQQLQMYEQINENNNNALKQLIQDKQLTQEQQLKFIKEQHAQEIAMHQKNLEENIQKNLKIINNLVQEKKEMSDQLEEVFQKLEEEKESNAQKLKKMKIFYEQEIKNQKDSILSKEKKEREKWQKEKAEKIRELTIKGLEPELQNLIEKHNLELKQLKLDYQQKLLKMRQELSAEQQLQLQQIKNSQLFFTSNIDFNQLTINNNISAINKNDNIQIDKHSSNNLQDECQFEKSPFINQNPAILDEISNSNNPNAAQNENRNGIFSSFNCNPSISNQNSDSKLQKIQQLNQKNFNLKVPDKAEGQINNIYSNQSQFQFQYNNNNNSNNNVQQPSQQSQLPQLIINNRVQNNFLTPHIKKKTNKQNLLSNN
ncbi:hypothetical protein TTHERM_00729200 (macronuclear) [Tetrahymena thermophila SB210]|uniref:Uncharacterized protein n=1 Tax=Tetrahymena thermophila (strain SB210) TaxID=312017 RepID=I7LWP3_TETTS|nr:hypothetical protein TTHERM_00729200 [Tetrahymena thermophila SB210]EAS02460.2 hypothetical protein TTHERM_00729200 [Tetrahymena thermophila SB210]|eukprot:XP_001022705.2 hypothetical protein TTHERM_00729200 [Tetrahymena thermophila SB210]